MGKQSARLYYKGKDHKDIFYQGNFHDKMYKGNQLLWEKLYPEAYFVTTRLLQNKYRYVTEIISRDGVDEIAQVPWDRNIENPKSYTVNDFCKKAILCNFRTHGYCYTIDMKHFKRISEQIGGFALGEGFAQISGNKLSVIKIINKTSYEVFEYDIDFSPINSGLTYVGNFLVDVYADIQLPTSDRIGISEWSSIDANGNLRKETKTYNLNNPEEAIEFGNEYSFTRNRNLRVVIGDYAYWCVEGASRISIGNIMISNSAKIMRKNLITFSEEVLVEIEDSAASIHFGDLGNLIYLSTTKAIYLGVLYRNYGQYRQSIVISVGDDGASIKQIQDMKIRVLGEDRYVDIIADFSFAYDEPIAINKIILNTANIRYLTVSSGFPTMHNGVYEPDAVAGMAFWFSYGYTNANPWYVMGYMYIDNFDFAESENNYIYITKEYVDGELVIDR